MRSMRKPAFGRMTVGICSLLLTWSLQLSPRAEAQTAGNNGVCNSASTTCSGSTYTTGSSAFIDATAVAQGPNICSTLYNILSAINYVPGTVIDARGISSGLSCAASPWFNGSSYQNKASTILLPAQAITIQTAWILPGGTKIIGEGAGSTTIKACGTSSCFSSRWMIQFGQACPSSPQCTGYAPSTGISVENLTLDGNAPNNGQTIGGILNAFSQELSYVDHVNLYQMLGIGLQISGSAQNSGPYSNITYDTNNEASTTATCVNISNVGGGTRGIHGLTCLGDSSSYAPVAVYLDSSNNSIEDVSISDFDDGILVGSQAAVQSNVLLNILGNTNSFRASPINVVHIPSNSNTVSDLSIMGVTNLGSGGVYTINDVRTSTLLTDKNVAMYVLGRSTADGYSRFTTSPYAATWVGGNTTPANPCAPGSLYSNTSSGAFYVCVYSGSSNTWSSVLMH